MKLSSSNLEAFYAVSRNLSFSKAAKELFITQSALSQRVLNLESALESKLFIRDPAGVKITDSGQLLLRHCQTQHLLEEEVLSKIKPRAGSNSKLNGCIRLGGYSTVMRSIAMKRISALLTSNPDVQIEMHVLETSELPAALRSGLIDYMLLDRRFDETSEIVSEKIGDEECVLVESKKLLSQRTNVYLDHHPEDQTTFRFLELQGAKYKGIRRSYLDDIYGIIDAVALGWGRAVIPKHLAQQRQDIKITAKQKSLFIPIFLHYYDQPYYTALQRQVLEALKADVL